MLLTLIFKNIPFPLLKTVPSPNGELLNKGLK
jgi:hypothetical protein